MGSAPSLGAPTWEGKTPTDQAPLQSSNPPINYTGSYGQPGNNFQGMGKSPQTGGGMSQAPGGMSQAPNGLSNPPGWMSQAPDGLSNPPGWMPQASNVPSNPIAQGGPQTMQPGAPQMAAQQDPMRQSIYSMMGGGSNGMHAGAVSPEYMAMVGRPDMQDAYRQRMASRPNVFF